MNWIALFDSDRQDSWADCAVFGKDTNRTGMLAQGSIVIETHLPASVRPRVLLRYCRGGPWPMQLSLQAVPGGGLTLILDQGGTVLHRTINHADIARTEALRLTYSWDAPGRWGRLALERTDSEKVLIEPVQQPRPLPLADALALSKPGPDHFVAPDVTFVAVSTAIEPVGPTPSLTLATPVATAAGYRPAGELRRGDTVLAETGESVPVLHAMHRTVPACGGFRPVGLRAPYFGLQQDLVLAPSQRLVLKGSEVEYLFGCEAVLAAAGHLAAGAAAGPVPGGRFATYCQLLLPGHEALVLAGTVAESLFIGRLRRNRALLEASLLARIGRHTLPDHGPPLYPVLRAFDAIVLSEQRAA